MKRRLGVWLIGAYGNVATCVVAGAAAVVRGLFDTTGLVTETPLLAGLPLVGLDEMVFGGHDVREGSLVASAKEFGDRNGLLTPELRAAVAADLRRADKEVRPGVLIDAPKSVVEMARPELSRPEAFLDAVRRIQNDLDAFEKRHRLDDVVVVNLASTEASPVLGPELRSLKAFERAVLKGRTDSLRAPSSIAYAYAAADDGRPFIDFTPSIAVATPLLAELARKNEVPCTGRDGKTGETLVKTVLAPMFLARNLSVLSWEGVNMLGNRDGAVLRDPGSLASKVRDKDEALRRILGDARTHSRVRIDYVPSLEDWKQAYDFIHFQGFLGARMQMHFLWQGCDSALAAPLVLDLVRLVDLAHRRGESGALPQLAPFFKTPLGVEEQDFASQMDRLARYAAEVRAETKRTRRAGA